MSLLKKLIIPVVLLALVAVAAFTMFDGPDQKTVTATFPRTVALYEGSEVRVLGIPVGQVDKVEPGGTTVEVTMSYDAEIDVPADAKAVIVSPSVVGDRFVQLTPVYEGGPTLEDGASIDIENTATPLELDEMFESLDELVVALGPQGANKNGALTELLDTTARNFGGQGRAVNRTIHDLGKLTGTLQNNKDELFGSARQLERFIGKLARNDGAVRKFNKAMASVSDMLAGERKDLQATLKHLGIALSQVKGFVHDNKTLLGKNIRGLNRVAKTLVKRRSELDEILHVAPLAVNNLAGTYNPQAGTLDTSANLGEVVTQLKNNPAMLLCTTLGTADKTGAVCGLIKQIFKKRGRTVPFGADRAQDPAFEALLEVVR